MDFCTGSNDFELPFGNCDHPPSAAGESAVVRECIITKA
jgi:hypothetical protein